MIKSYAKDNEPMLLLSRAASKMAHGKIFHEHTMLVTHQMGFQGHKRWHKMQMLEDQEGYIEILNYCIDMFDSILEIDWEYTVPTPKSFVEYVDAYLEWEIGVYEELTDISNQLVIKGFAIEAETVSAHLPGVRKEIEKCRRWLKDYEVTSGDMAYFKLMDKKLHDKVKEMTEK